MGKKSERLSIIKRIIAEELIGSQEELIQHLEKRGIHATQSTLSRDFKEINISKMPHPEKGYIYVSAENIVSRSEFGTSNLGDAIMGVKFSGNMGVIITKSGYANAIGVIVDSRKSPYILGTVAGDNTIIMVLREDASHKLIMDVLISAFPELSVL
jgi:transcriptional regulator of arginine metabolism